jgi:hypothetical protein
MMQESTSGLAPYFVSIMTTIVLCTVFAWISAIFLKFRISMKHLAKGIAVDIGVIKEDIRLLATFGVAGILIAFCMGMALAHAL